MRPINTIKPYLPYSGHQYVALEKNDVTGQSTLEADIERSSTLSTRTFSKIWLGPVYFLLGVFTGVFLLSCFPRENALSTTPGVPRSVTEAVIHKSWKPDDRFAWERHDNESAAAWETLRSRFILIDNPIQKGLHPSWPQGASRQSYSVAAFHQLHCTYVIYYAWNSLVEHGPSILDNDFPGTRGGYTIGNHFGHCVEIIRQALMCYADATLEPLLDMSGQTISEDGLASGWGTTHTCKDIDKLAEWVDAQEEGTLTR